MADTYVVDAVTGKATILKDPQAVLDYSWDWTAWLDAVTDTITSQVVTVPSGMTLGNVTRDVTDKIVTAIISGGTAGTTYPVACKITTVGGRTDERTIYLKVKDR